MLLDVRTAGNISSSFFPVPGRDSGVVRRYRAGKLEIRIHKNPGYEAENAFVRIEWAATAWHKGRCLFSADLQRDDLRALSSELGISLKELQADYGVKGFYGPETIGLYSSEAKESLGPYLGAQDEETVIDFLVDIVLDTFDEPADPVLLA